MTASHSASLMFVSMRSRRMPALLMRMSRPPKVSTADCTRRSAPSQSLMSSVLAMASPPMASISSTTSWAGPWSVPSPSIEPPRSLTTTLAPWWASSSACSRPMPRPAPVTMATRPSQSLAHPWHSPSLSRAPRPQRGILPSSARHALRRANSARTVQRARLAPPWTSRSPSRQRTRLRSPEGSDRPRAVDPIAAAPRRRAGSSRLCSSPSCCSSLIVIAWAVDTSVGGVPRNVRLAGEDVGGLSEAELTARVASLAERLRRRRSRS